MVGNYSSDGNHVFMEITLVGLCLLGLLAVAALVGYLLQMGRDEPVSWESYGFGDRYIPDPLQLFRPYKRSLRPNFKRLYRLS